MAMFLLEILVQLLSLKATGLYTNECDPLSPRLCFVTGLFISISVIKGSRGLAHAELEDLPGVERIKFLLIACI